MKSFAPRAIFFDLDGTLVDSVPDLAEAVRRMLVELGEPSRTDAEVATFVGKGIPTMVERALTVGRAPISPELLAQAITSFMRHYEDTNGKLTRAYPGVVEALPVLRARGLKMGVVTNKAEAFIGPLLDELGLGGFFDCLVGGDSLAKKKPDPEPLWHACQTVGVSREEALMVGDSGNDALCARRAGIPVLLMTYGYNEGVPVDTEDCDGLLSSFLELPPLLKTA
ncbi:MAG: phosphoglycolate phosphatase [Candidatus Dactylopiibacterium carminicum]|uniref:Phosphoglycolate phosphatase n=1 Tax=Candidatus Dactylopiibacterium carminicum TaxID=857335 RepID=A0A272EQQ3_9RHOO|nr:phosphoglycolate phosphatase [Candidatus Dactylopiibacterium carminicum]KAF7599285.1 phosphoglycolate phosphatase [Candidatus Dactylopiibacterium carminicum]PAS92447.1 MAG: phosphoglycolate phosphatase [Candidatus Dactylopiibacterium carminicum]PAS97165.1 MAG: phosphoglycolate phosphatase [Candidatus Dactylopiibacterium carminicum]PAS99291.1 MAG: phosphoglycolate phosphatase [Candidatus Dactylopiibacterium carminicum]